MTAVHHWNLPQSVDKFVHKADNFISGALDSCAGPLNKLGNSLKPHNEYIALVTAVAATAFALYTQAAVTAVGLGIGLLVGTEILPSLTKVCTIVTDLFNKVFGNEGGKIALATAGLALTLFSPACAATAFKFGVGVFSGQLAGKRVPINHPKEA